MRSKMPLKVGPGDRVVVFGFDGKPRRTQAVEKVSEAGQIKLDDGTRWNAEGQPHGSNRGEFGNEIAVSENERIERHARARAGARLQYLGAWVSDGSVPKEVVNVLLDALHEAGFDLDRANLQEMIASVRTDRET